MTIEYGTCPVCNGSGRMPTPDNLRRYGEKNGWYGYDKADDCCTCTNCGGQTMYGKPSGKVRLNKNGVPCTHKYTSRNVGRCLTEYTCSECGNSYEIDSGD
jgi:hypothetical protein